MTITPIRAPRATAPVRPCADRAPTETDLFPHLGKDEVCIYCGCFQTDEQAETDRTVDHVARDLAAIHRVRETLRTEFGIEYPGFEADVYDLLCELDNAVATTQPKSEAGPLHSCPDCDAAPCPDCDLSEVAR